MGGGKLSDRSNRFLFLFYSLVPVLRCIFRADKGLCRRRNPASIRITEVCPPRTLHNEAFATKTLFGMDALSATEGAG
jgi:hypothetical protein